MGKRKREESKEEEAGSLERLHHNVMSLLRGGEGGQTSEAIADQICRMMASYNSMAAITAHELQQPCMIREPLTAFSEMFQRALFAKEILAVVNLHFIAFVNLYQCA